MADRVQEIKRLRDEGKTCKEIGELLGISKQRVSALYYSQKKDNKKTKWSSFYPVFIKEYEDGLSIQKISEKYKCSSRTVFVALKKAGYEKKLVKSPVITNQ
jgi:hypothetical protein